jgi:ribose transport system permease protein
MTTLRLWLAQNYGILLAIGVFVLMFTLYVSNHPAGLTVPVVTTAANKAVLLALVAMAQTIPVLTGGLDLSVGMIFIMTNSLASTIVIGTPIEVALGVFGVVGAGTLATGAIYYGIALWIRPIPGGDVHEELADFMTYTVFEVVPTSLVLLALVVVLFWIPFRHSVVGRGCYAAGSAEGAAYMSGVRIGQSKLAAYGFAGFLAGIAGLMLTFITYSGEASAPIGGTYTLNSIAAVVIGGTSLYGGSGGAIGSIFGAFILRTIDDLLFVFDLPPLWQPLFQGVVLLLAVSMGAARVFRIRNRLELFH